MSVVNGNFVSLREQRRESAAHDEGKAALFQGVKVERPVCPAWLNKEAKTHYKFLVKELEESALIAKIDMGVLAIMATSYAGMMLAEKQLQEDGGDLQQTPNGYMQLSAAAISFDRHSSRYEKLAKQFGITVRSRQSIKAVDNPNQGDLDL